MPKLLYVVHRYAPYPGGSEMNTKRFAEASVTLGYDVTVLAGTHMGDYNGVRVTSDPNVITENFDLCIVHGWTGGAQNYVIQNAHLLRCPLYYLIIKTDPRPEVNMALEKATYIGCATAQDGAFAMLRGHENKIQRIKYPINYKRITKTREEIRNEFELTKDRVFISVGGFAPHKGMNELVEAFEEFKDPNTELVLAGYDLNHGVPDVSKCKSKIQLYNLEDQQSVYELMSVADLLIWNSLKGTEGYGLVLLEAMLYGCKWYARDDVAGMDLAMLGYGTSYHTKDQLVELMKNYDPENPNAETKKKEIMEEHDPVVTTAEMLKKVGLRTDFQTLLLDTIWEREMLIMTPSKPEETPEARRARISKEVDEEVRNYKLKFGIE